MKARGRPRHPEILTPRQQEVLACLREGLTNEEIARRLGITLDGAKFHVSEILLRLGVDNRYDAANWSPEPEPARGRWAFALAPFALLHRAKWSAASYAAATVVVLGAAVGVALLAWGVVRSSGGSARQTPAAGAVGAANPELIIYTTLAPGGAFGTHMQWTVNVFDTSAGRVAHSFPIGDGVNEQPVEVVAAGDKLVANLTDRIVRYDIDGSHATELLHVDGANVGVNPPRVIGIGASPDGSKIALTEQTQQLCPTAVAGAEATPQLCRDYASVTRVAVIRTTDGTQLLSVPQTAPGFAGYHGQAGEVTWRSDSKGFVVTGLTYSEAAGGVATVMLDGSVTVANGVSPSISPNGLYATAGDVTLVCGQGGLAVQHEIMIRELIGGSVVARVSEPALNLTPDSWGPAGTSLLYHTGAIIDDPARPGCQTEDPQSERWYLLPADGSPPSEASGLLPARQTWWGARTIEFACEGKPVVNFYPDPTCVDANGREQPVEASIHGEAIGSGLQWHTVQDVPARQEGLR